MSNNKPIILSIIIFLLFSFAFLAYTETRQQSATNQNWWIVYFENPKNESLSFIIENNSKADDFRWELSSGESTIRKEDIKIKKGEIGKIEISGSEIENSENKKITIKIDSQNETRMLYKILEK